MRSHVVLKVVLVAVLLIATVTANDEFTSWSLSRAIRVLNDSPWARQETFTQLIGGIGSGIQGEKEIYNTFFVRLLSALPVRKAFARIEQIQVGYDLMTEEEKKKIDQKIRRGLELDVSRWIVVAVTFRSNNPSQESRVNQFLLGQTTETMKTRAYLSSEQFPKLQISAYYNPKDSAVGAKFVFPRRVDGKDVVLSTDDSVSFELFVPGADPQLRATFEIADMIVEDELVI
jgi:hypothetical protein